MTDETRPLDEPMPEAPWWSQPSATAVLPPQVYDESVAQPSERKRRSGLPWLLALALIVGGGVGGAVATALDEDTTGTTTVTQTRIVDSSGKIVTGTPESAASIIGPSVVTVEVTGQSDFGRTTSSKGSGIIIRSSGFILTNSHVVASAGRDGTVHVTLTDGKTIEADIVGAAPSIDLAVLKIDGVSGLKAATFADSDKLLVGQAVLAVGAPLGLANTVTQGIVSTLNRPVRTGDSNALAVFDAVQTDAAINPGNSGGALVDLAGRVVGVNSAIASTGGAVGGQAGNIGVGFAIPSSMAVRVADQLMASGKATHAQMGVTVADAPTSTDGAPGLGATIQGVSPGGPAQQAGLRPGDVVTKVNERRVTDADSLIVAVRSHAPGSTVTVTFVRGGSTQTAKVKLASTTS